VGKSPCRHHVLPRPLCPGSAGAFFYMPFCGGYDDLRERVKSLETSVDHIVTDITSVKDDIRDMRNIGIGVTVAIFGALFGLYIYIGSETKDLDDKFDDLRVSVTEDIADVKEDITLIKVQNDNLAEEINNITVSLSKLVGLQETIK
jgi:hypothetical protein